MNLIFGYGLSLTTNASNSPSKLDSEISFRQLFEFCETKLQTPTTKTTTWKSAIETPKNAAPSPSQVWNKKKLSVPPKKPDLILGYTFFFGGSRGNRLPWTNQGRLIHSKFLGHQVQQYIRLQWHSLGLSSSTEFVLGQKIPRTTWTWREMEVHIFAKALYVFFFRKSPPRYE